MRYTLAPIFRCDLEEIARWIAADSPDRAGATLRQIRDALPDIANSPLHYRLRPEIGKEARLALVGRYAVLFRIVEETVRFERVADARRDLPNLYRTGRNT